MTKNILTIISASSLFLFSGCGEKENDKNELSQNIQPKVIQCKTVKLPEFTLSKNSNPTEAQIENLCQCLSNKLVGWEQDTVIKIVEKRENEISELHMRAFPARFGQRMKECGAFEL